MKKILLLVAVIVVTTVVTAQEIKKIKAADIVKIMDTTTSPLVINFWATWCRPCVNELNYFEKVIDKFKDKNVTLILVSLDFPEDYAKLPSFVAAKGYNAIVYWLNEPETSVIQTQIDNGFEGVIPATLMINKVTSYRKFHSGQLTANTLKKEIEKLVK
jgi:thiol-disulfide isomerase/thioredoxin